MDKSNFQQIPFVAGTNIYLRGLSLEDAEGNYVNWINSSEVCLYNSHHRFPYTKKQAISYIENLINDKSKLVFAIIENHTSTHIGNISLQDIDYISRTADIAFILGEKEYWGKGIAFEVGRLMLEHGFKQLNLHRITLGTSIENIGMIKVAEKLGFTKEGVRRQAHFKNGKYSDIIEFGLLRSEWKELNK